MDTQKINAELNRRFAEPLPEFYKRRIIVWHDDDKEFEDKLEEIKLENAKLLVLNGSNFFQAKKLLLEPQSTTATHLFSLSLLTGHLDPPRGQELAQERLPAEDRCAGHVESLK